MLTSHAYRVLLGALALIAAAACTTRNGAIDLDGPAMPPAAVSPGATVTSTTPSQLPTAGSAPIAATTDTAPPTAQSPVVAPVGATAMPSTGVTFNKDIRPLMAANCSMACHGPDPATRAGPMALDTYESVHLAGELVVAAVMSNKMPPWPQANNCREMRDTPSLNMEQRALFMKWQEAGFPEGDVNEFVAPPPDVEADLGEPTRIVEMAQAHTPPANADQYYCGKVAHVFEQDTYLRAIEVIPDQKTMVHHVQVHVVNSSACTNGDNMYSWRPGGRRLTFSKGDAALLPAGSSFALQMHYNTFGKTPAPDKTKVALWELPAGEKPERVVTRIGVMAGVSAMPPGAVTSSRISRSVGGAGVEIIGISPHAHMIAKHLGATLSRSGGKTECLSEVPDWNFEWQLDYIFKDPLPLAAGDVVNAVCDYDNGPNHQPTVDGVKRQQAITVTQGEGSADEMCLHYVWLRRPLR